ncbi:MAG TPA: Ger(x)C family spore germination protein, partial [Peptococcaceae bacterium]|nr:Ger(x)C family spore germination protein [Peptococcaceae bacterium]
MKQRVIALILLIFFIISLSGGWDREEIDDMAFISMVGVDSAGPDELLVSFQFVNPGGLAKGGGG